MDEVKRQSSLTIVRDCDRELDAVNLGRLLDSDRLRTDESFEETLAMIQQAKAIISKYRALMSNHFDQSRKEIRNLNINASARTALLNGYDTSVAPARLVDTQLDLQSPTLAALEKIFALLRAKTGDYVV
jgi:hypothetical protein